MKAKFAHVNLVAQDWRQLADFYRRVFGCTAVPPERDLRGAWLDAGTGLANAHIQGLHLRLPGHGAQGPTLEIFQYTPQQGATQKAVNRPGWGHVAFAVDDVQATVDKVLAAGGSMVGKIVSPDIAGAGQVTFAYVRDPEGNTIELQRWEARAG
jgi:catechol 2,3-dioxygenase-like lactoylglutathione lyase family enzyme